MECRCRHLKRRFEQFKHAAHVNNNTAATADNGIFFTENNLLNVLCLSLMFSVVNYS